MSRSVVITGIGVVLPDASTVEDIWDHQTTGRSLISPLSDALKGTVIDESAIEGVLSPRLSKKLDSFTRYALVATQRALEDARLGMAEVDKARCGVFVGNSFGGWRFTETELRHLHQEGPRMVSPFQATSWFPAAPQGQITILHQIKGFSKTYMADRASSLVSVGSAASMIARGQLDVAIAGGTESTNTDFVKAALAPFGGYGGASPWPTSVPPEAYGFLVSEGAVFLILEDHARAEARGAAIYAEVGGCATRNAPCLPHQYAADRSSVARAMTAALRGATPDVVLPDACGTAEADGAEVAALAEVCPKAAAVVPKMKYGHTFGAEGALDIAYACLMFRKGRSVPVPYTPRADVDAATRAEGAVGGVLINGRSLGGAVSSLFLSKGND